jgi:hypothetical protein
VLCEQEEEIDYDPSNDDYTLPVAMKPGVVASWPRKAPHRIDNSDCVNVSLSCGFKTFGPLVHANGAMRLSWGLNPSIERDGALARYSKAGLARAFKLFNSRKSFKKQIKPTLVVDLEAENAVRDLVAA